MPLTDACAGVTTAIDLAACIVATVANTVDGLLPVEYSAPDQVLATAEERVCQAAIARVMGKSYALRRTLLYTTCLARREAGAVPWCLSPGLQGRLDQLRSGVEPRLAGRCTDGVVQALDAVGGFHGSCVGVTTVAELAACEIAEHDVSTTSLLGILP